MNHGTQDRFPPHQFRALMLGTALLTGLYPGLLAADEMPTDQFIRQYRAATAQLTQAASHVQCDLSQILQLRQKSAEEPVKTRRITYRYAADGSREKLEYYGDRDESDADAPEYVRRVLLTIDNKTIVLKSSSENAPYFVYNDGTNSTSFAKYLDKLKADSVDLMRSPAVFDMSEHIDSPDFSVEKAEHVEQGGELLIRAHVRWKVVKPDEPTAVTRVSGWIIVDPARTYAMREYELHGDVTKTGATVLATGKIDYTDAKGLPVPTRFTSLSTIDAPKIKGAKLGRTLDVDRWEYSSPPTEMFTLGGYGLGDVETPRARGGGYVAYMAFGIAAAALAASLWLRRIAGGFRRADSPSA